MTLAHETHGDPTAPPVVLLHGFPLDRSMWRSVAPGLAQAGFHVVLPDLPGHGGSAVPEEPSVEAMASAVLDLLDALDAPRFVLGGFSMGGYVALAMAEAAPHRLRGFALLGSRASADSEDVRAGRARTAQQVREAGMRPLVASMLPRMLTAAALRGDAALVAEVRAMMERQPPDGAVAALEAMAARPDRLAPFAALACPVLVVAAAEDPVVPVEEARRLAEAARGTLAVVPGAHLAPMEAPEAYRTALLSWLRSL